MKTLLLSPSYFPIRIISWERAIKMRFEETADVVAEYRDEIRSPSVTWRIPAVVRERRVANVKQVIRFSRSNVYLRDGYRCQYCGKKFDAKGLTYDHVVPRCQGGKTEWANIVAACRAAQVVAGAACADRPRLGAGRMARVPSRVTACSARNPSDWQLKPRWCGAGLENRGCESTGVRLLRLPPWKRNHSWE
jgi:5-methylcytosine-specific restriction endonuclease McrA